MDQNQHQIPQSPMPVMPNAQQFSQQPSPQFSQQSSANLPQFRPASSSQQANMMNNAYLSNLMQNNGLSYTPPATNRKQYINMPNIKSKDECISDLISQSFRDDFDTVVSMNLIDNDDDVDDNIRYTLYMSSPSFEIPSYMLNLLCAMYRKKYKKLYKKYPSLEVFASFCLSTVIYNSEAHLRNICNSSSFNLPKAGNNIKFKVKRRRLENKLEDSDSFEESKKNNRLLLYPLFNLKYYQEHQVLFKIGSLTKYCVPSEFALLFCNATPGIVKKHLKLKETMEYTGIKGAFQRPVTFILKSRVNKEFVFINVEHLDSVGKLLSKMTGFTTETDTFGLGMKINMDSINITTNNKFKIDQYTKFDSGYYLGVLSSFSCVGTDAKILNIRSYVDTVYSLDSNIIDLPQEEVTQYEKFNASRADLLLEALEEFEKLYETPRAPLLTKLNSNDLTRIDSIIDKPGEASCKELDEYENCIIGDSANTKAST